MSDEKQPSDAAQALARELVGWGGPQWRLKEIALAISAYGEDLVEQAVKRLSPPPPEGLQPYYRCPRCKDCATLKDYEDVVRAGATPACPDCLVELQLVAPPPE